MKVLIHCFSSNQTRHRLNGTTGKILAQNHMAKQDHLKTKCKIHCYVWRNCYNLSGPIPSIKRKETTLQLASFEVKNSWEGTILVSLTIGPTKLFLIRYKTVQVKSTITLIEHACLFCLRWKNRQTPRVFRTVDHTSDQTKTCYFHMGFH